MQFSKRGAACEQIRVVDYACLLAVSARHWAFSALRGTDARRSIVRCAPHDVGTTCSVCRRLIQVLADRACTGFTSPSSRPHVGFTAAPARRSGFEPYRPSSASHGPDRADQCRAGHGASANMAASRAAGRRTGAAGTSTSFCQPARSRCLRSKSRTHHHRGRLSLTR